jgi:hypothetical protein
MNELKSMVPIMSSRAFSEVVGIPLGVIEAQMDRRQLPVIRIGKRRFVNLLALSDMALANFASHRPQRSEDGAKQKPLPKQGDGSSNTSQNAQF